MMNTILVQVVLNPAKVVFFSLMEKKKAMTSLAENAFYSQATKSRGRAILLTLPRVPFI